MYSLQGFPDKGSNAGVSHESLAGLLAFRIRKGVV